MALTHNGKISAAIYFMVDPMNVEHDELNVISCLIMPLDAGSNVPNCIILQIDSFLVFR
ncbi:hypothetical protein M8C21_001946, partial [Ambrosia artemisiifolia]